MQLEVSFVTMVTKNTYIHSVKLKKVRTGRIQVKGHAFFPLSSLVTMRPIPMIRSCNALWVIQQCIMGHFYNHEMPFSTQSLSFESMLPRNTRNKMHHGITKCILGYP